MVEYHHRCTSYDSLYHVFKKESFDKITDAKSHWHSSFELFFFTKGNGTHHINNEEYPISAGDVFLISPNDSHCYFTAPDQKSVSFVRINFSNAFYFYYINPDCRFETLPVKAHLSEKDFGKMCFLTRTLLSEQALPDSASKHELGLSIIEQILILLSRNSRQIGSDIQDDNLKKALVYIQHNFHNQIRVSDVARAVSYSPNYLSSKFSKVLKISIHDYIQDVRLYYARDLIKYSEYSISEICYKSGFKSMAYFSKAFKQKFSVSPNSLRSEE